jgi:tRNA U34 2-thiouridine synthase MnmA/TrmU
LRNNKSNNNATKKERANLSIDQAMTMFDAYEEYRPENVIEIFLSDFNEGNSVRPDENIWFFTRC